MDFGTLFTHPIISDIVNLLIAYVLAIPIGLDREHEEKSAGIRTFPIVGVASCALAVIAMSMKGATPDAYSRIIQGLITGIGFIGGGAILKERGSVSGTATAASVWATGIIGAAVGLRMYHIAVTVTVINLLTLRLMRQVKKDL